MTMESKIMKLKNIIAASALLLMAACGAPVADLAVEGVSLELAESRAQSISAVEYTLSFSIPESRTGSIRGHGQISFEAASPLDLILDFTSDAFSGVTVNGNAVEAEYRSEHILIPASAVTRGQNVVELDFVPDDRFLNRNDEYLYTLFVPSHARSAFPCFDQPDMKARFSLTLEIPSDWAAVSNAAAVAADGGEGTMGRKTVSFGKTELIPTYLFAFAAGKWQSISSQVGGREVTAYYRETDPAKIAQFPDIFNELGQALDYLEDFTGIPLPFGKYDFVVIPGFQFGGMEHPGTVFYNENTMFLGKNPTVSEREKRIQLIAHETAHMWFGDMVTMRWFNDVWTKEVYANYFAAEMTEPMFPEIDHDLAWLQGYYVPAYADDRTSGSTPIRQDLGNLADAGLIYSNIIYDKAPIVMRAMVDYMGKDNFREGIREYLRTFAYSNATWDDLIEILDSHSDRDVKGFSDVWVYRKGMPSISVKAEDGKLAVEQTDPLGRGISWPQSLFCVSDTGVSIEVELGEGKVVRDFSCDSYFIPNADGRTYGAILMEDSQLRALLAAIAGIDNAQSRESALMIVNENYLRGNFTDSSAYLDALLDILEKERDAQIASLVISQIGSPLLDLPADQRAEPEHRLLGIARSHPMMAVHQQLLRTLDSYAVGDEAVGEIYRIWESEDDASLNVNDYISMSYQLAVRRPEDAHRILALQRGRIDGSDPERNFNRDRLRQFDFISRAALPEADVREALFQDLLKAENRTVEPWAETALSLLNHFLRDDESVKFIRPGLDALLEVKATGDIFFPAAWCRALLGGHRSEEGYHELESFLADNPDYPQLLRNKIMLNAYGLERAHSRR